MARSESLINSTETQFLTEIKTSDPSKPLWLQIPIPSAALEPSPVEKAHTLVAEADVIAIREHKKNRFKQEVGDNQLAHCVISVERGGRVIAEDISQAAEVDLFYLKITHYPEGESPLENAVPVFASPEQQEQFEQAFIDFVTRNPPEGQTPTVTFGDGIGETYKTLRDTVLYLEQILSDHQISIPVKYQAELLTTKIIRQRSDTNGTAIRQPWVNYSQELAQVFKDRQKEITFVPQSLSFQSCPLPHRPSCQYHVDLRSETKVEYNIWTQGNGPNDGPYGREPGPIKGRPNPYAPPNAFA